MSKASEEAQKQLDRIVALGYPDVADMSAGAFRALARPLIRALEDSDLGSDILLVPTRELVSPESLIARTSINRMAGFTTMPPRDIASFLPQDGFEPPEGPFYLVLEPHTGTCYINREPDVARKLIDSDERLPLTLEEGLAIATQHPEWLLEKNGFNLLGSRSADGRVPSIWMSQNAPRLGAVWPNSRHTWLGNAYCVARRGVSLFHRDDSVRRGGTEYAGGEMLYGLRQTDRKISGSEPGPAASRPAAKPSPSMRRRCQRRQSG